VSSSDETLRYIAKSLNEMRRRSYGDWSPALESLRLLANQDDSERQGAPLIGDVADSRLAVDIDEAARRLSISKRTVQRLVASGECPTVVIGGCVRIVVADLEALVESTERRRSA
jgi:excisionase family DNA binding protein